MLPGPKILNSVFVSSKLILIYYIEGDGIGPEMMNYVKEVFRYAGVPVDFEEIHFDPNSESEVDFFDAITSIKRNGVAIKGNYCYI